MNLRIALATAMLLTGGTYAADAQQKNAAQSATVTTVNAKTFAGKIKEYEKATDTKQSASLLQGMQEQMTAGLAEAKQNIASSSDDAGRTKMMKLYETRMGALNEVVKLGHTAQPDKASVVSSLKKYAATL